MVDLTKLLETTPVEMVGGALVVYHEGTHIDVGVVTAAGVVLTAAGEAYLEPLGMAETKAAEAEVEAVLLEAAENTAEEDHVLSAAEADQAALAAALG